MTRRASKNVGRKMKIETEEKSWNVCISATRWNIKQIDEGREREEWWLELKKRMNPSERRISWTSFLFHFFVLLVRATYKNVSISSSMSTIRFHFIFYSSCLTFCSARVSLSLCQKLGKSMLIMLACSVCIV